MKSTTNYALIFIMVRFNENHNNWFSHEDTKAHQELLFFPIPCASVPPWFKSFLAGLAKF